MVHGILQFTPRIAFRYVLHRCESLDIRCRESLRLFFRIGDEHHVPPPHGWITWAFTSVFLGACRAGMVRRPAGRRLSEAGKIPGGTEKGEEEDGQTNDRTSGSAPTPAPPGGRGQPFASVSSGRIRQ